MKLRTFNLLLALAFVATFGETFHFALVDHHYCAAHGALEHGEGAEAVSQEHSEGQGLAFEASVVSRDHAHTDCLLARSPQVLDARVSLASLGSNTQAVIGESRSAFLAFDLLHLAPKLPPPA